VKARALTSTTNRDTLLSYLTNMLHIYAARRLRGSISRGLVPAREVVLVRRGVNSPRQDLGGWGCSRPESIPSPRCSVTYTVMGYELP
jgi:hypothetical protein